MRASGCSNDLLPRSVTSAAPRVGSMRNLFQQKTQQNPQGPKRHERRPPTVVLADESGEETTGIVPT